MNVVEEFISKVEAHPILYNKDSKSKKSQEQREKLWRQIAEQSHFENATAAQEKWQQLLLEYLEYLRRGAQFSNATAMKFMQPYMLHAIYDSDENSGTDTELDDATLHRIINSDDESEVEQQQQQQAKRFKSSKGKESSKSESTRTIKNQKHEEITDADSSGSTKLNTTSNTPSETCSSANLSNFSSLELIFLGYAKVLQKMPLPLQLETKRKISDIMDEAEMKLFELK